MPDFAKILVGWFRHAEGRYASAQEGVLVALAMVVMMGPAFLGDRTEGGGMWQLLSRLNPQQVQGTAATFQSGPEVTKTGLTCHTEAAKQIHQTPALEVGLRQSRHQAEIGQAARDQ